MEKVFIDANTLLDFYRYGQDDIDEIGKVVHLINENELQLFTTQLLMDEVYRMREAELSRVLAELRNQAPQIKVPTFVKTFDEYTELTSKLKLANAEHGKLIARINELVEKRMLEADKLLAILFKEAKLLKTGKKVMNAAKQRNILNNPPRKKGDSMSDALHWEALLREEGVIMLHLVSKDGDFASELSPNHIKRFLHEEWIEKKNEYATVHLYKNLSSFFKARFPDIVLSAEVEKADLISQLYLSSSFQETHEVVAELSKHTSFTTGQAARLFEALWINNQVYWIAKDDDVNNFFRSLQAKSFGVPNEIQADIAKYLGVKKDDFFLPF